MNVLVFGIKGRFQPSVPFVSPSTIHYVSEHTLGTGAMEHHVGIMLGMDTVAKWQIELVYFQLSLFDGSHPEHFFCGTDDNPYLVLQQIVENMSRDTPHGPALPTSVPIVVIDDSADGPSDRWAYPAVVAPLRNRGYSVSIVRQRKVLDQGQAHP
ncbi:MAG: hypothetical protein U0136_14010 [Bdellovibrionota bacterium]